MKRFKDLFISCDQDSARAFFARTVEHVSSLTSKNWSVDHANMNRFADNICFVKGLFVCLILNGTDDKPFAGVTLVYDDDKRRIWLSNIVPCQMSQFSIEEYNGVFDRFCREILEAVKADLKYEETGDVFSGCDVMSGESWKLLGSFCALANRSSLHPFDVQRWHQFVISIYNAGTRLDSSTLERILREEFEWDDSGALRLASLYEDEIELLKEYAER